MSASALEARLQEQAQTQKSSASVLARLLGALVCSESDDSCLPSSTCCVKPLRMGHESDIHLLLFEVDPLLSPLEPDRLILKHKPTISWPSRELLSLLHICPLIERETALFPRVLGTYNGSLGEAILQEYIEPRRDRPPTEEPAEYRPPASARAPPVDPGPALDSTEDSNDESAPPLVEAAGDLPNFPLPKFTLADYRLAVRALARLHAPFLGSNHLLEALASQYPFLTEPLPHVAQRVKLTKNDIELLVRRYDALPPHLRPEPRRMEWLMAVLRELPSWRAVAATVCPRTLLHGDARMTNFIIRDVPLTINEQEVVVLKPNFAIGSPTLDLALLLTWAWAAHHATPPLAVPEAMQIYAEELAAQGCEWLAGGDAEAKLMTLMRGLLLEAVCIMLLHAIDLLEAYPDLAGQRFEHLIDHIICDLEPQCRQTIALLEGKMQVR